MISQQEVAKKWQEQGYSCGLWTDSPGQNWENFTHEVDELVMVVEGEVEFEFESKIYHPKIGEELLIPSGTRHSVRNVGKTTSNWFYGYKR